MLSVFQDVIDGDARVARRILAETPVFRMELDQSSLDADLDVAPAVFEEDVDDFRRIRTDGIAPDRSRGDVEGAEPVHLHPDVQPVSVQQQRGDVVPGECTVGGVPVAEALLLPVEPVQTVVLRSDPEHAVLSFDEVADHLGVKGPRNRGRGILRDESLFGGRVVDAAAVGSDPDAALVVLAEGPDGVVGDGSPFAQVLADGFECARTGIIDEQA